MSASEEQEQAIHPILNMSPHNRALGMKLEKIEGTVLTTSIPYKEEFVGNPQTGVLHGGTVTAFLDAACGMAVMLAIGKAERIATLDLRIDYLRPTTKDLPLYSRCECFKLGKQVAFTRGTAYHLLEDGEEREVATAVCTYMLTGRTQGKVVPRAQDEVVPRAPKKTVPQ